MSQNDRDRRKAKRRTFTIRAPISTGSSGGEIIENSSTIDISESGVRLRLRGHIVPGQIVEVFLANRPERCRVVWTTPGGANELIAGLEFLRPLPEP
jgi:hypothetical protein